MVSFSCFIIYLHVSQQTVILTELTVWPLISIFVAGVKQATLHAWIAAQSDIQVICERKTSQLMFVHRFQTYWNTKAEKSEVARWSQKMMCKQDVVFITLDWSRESEWMSPAKLEPQAGTTVWRHGDLIERADCKPEKAQVPAC